MTDNGHHAAASDARIHAEQIEIRVAPGHVDLSGLSESQREAMEQAVRIVYGIGLEEFFERAFLQQQPHDFGARARRR